MQSCGYIQCLQNTHLISDIVCENCDLIHIYLHRALYVNMVGLWVTVSLAMLSGLTMYSIYKDCDPFTNKDVGATDQVIHA